MDEVILKVKNGSKQNLIGEVRKGKKR